MNFWFWTLGGFAVLALLFHIGYRKFICPSCCFMAGVGLSIFLFSYILVETGLYVPTAPVRHTVVAQMQQDDAPATNAASTEVQVAALEQKPATVPAAVHTKHKPVRKQPARKAAPVVEVAMAEREPDLADILWREGDIVLEDCH